MFVILCEFGDCWVSYDEIKICGFVISCIWCMKYPKFEIIISLSSFQFQQKYNHPNHSGYRISEKTKICCAPAPERKSTELEKRDSKTWDDHREWSSNQVMKDFVRQRKGLGFCSVGWLIELLKQVSESWSLNFRKYCEPVFKHHPHSRLN